MAQACVACQHMYGRDMIWPSMQIALSAVLPVIQLHVCSSVSVPGQGCCHFCLVSCLGPLGFLPHSPYGAP